jgi:hypothetical protein
MRRQQSSRLGDDKDRDRPLRQFTKAIALVKPSVEPRGEAMTKNRRSKETQRPSHLQKNSDPDTQSKPPNVSSARNIPKKRSSRQFETARSFYAKKPLGDCNADRLTGPESVRRSCSEPPVPFCPMIGEFKVEFGADMWDTSDESEDEAIDKIEF